MSFSPGKADQPITIQTATVTVDGLGATSYSWAALTKAPTWAEYVPLRGTERIEAGKLTATTEFKLRIRRDTRVTSACRVTHGGKTYRITGVEDNHREGSMVLHCAQVV
jgi:SPP1 family predicted phage head-tail adaptor